MSDVTSQARPSLFRGEAFEYHFREQESRGVLNTSIRHPWSIAIVSIVLLCVALTYTLSTQVEVVYRAEGSMRVERAPGSLDAKQLAILYVHGTADPQLNPGARVRLELLRPIDGRSQFLDGRLTAAAREPSRLEIALDQPEEDRASVREGALLPVRIHAVVCKQSLWRVPLNATSGCLER
jgi:hypothetical protein